MDHNARMKKAIDDTFREEQERVYREALNQLRKYDEGRDAIWFNEQRERVAAEARRVSVSSPPMRSGRRKRRLVWRKSKLGPTSPDQSK